MLNKLLTLAALAAAATLAHAEPATPLVVTDYDAPYAAHTFPRQGSWLGLYCIESECELRAADVQIVSMLTEHMDEPVQTESLLVSGQPLALFHGVDLSPGAVDGWFVANRPPQESGAHQQLSRLGRWHLPWGATPLTLSWVQLPDHGGYRYHLSDGHRKQFLFGTADEGEHGGETTPFVQWAGDIDGDGEVDLLVSLPDDTCGYDERLYLSSQARPGQFLRKAAQLHGGFAACGC